jgi:hypothetical protein
MSVGLTKLIRSLALMTLIKNLGRHIYTRAFLARLAHRIYWTGLDTDLAAQGKNLGPSPVRNTVFSYFTL